MDDRQLSEDLIDFNFDDIFNFTFDLDSLNSLDKISTQWLDELTSSITIENNETLARNTTIQNDRTADASTKTVGVTNQENREHIDIERNNNPEPTSNLVENTVLSEAVQNDATFSSPLVDLQKENIVPDLLPMQNNDLTIKPVEPKICLSEEELSVLEREFQICHYPDRFTRKKLALTLNLSRLTVSEWFTNRRIKMRKQTSDNVDENDETRKIRFSKSQVAMLEREFRKSQYPDCLTRQKLSLMLGLRDVTVKNWFHCRRVKMRKLIEVVQLSSLQMKSNTLSVSETVLQRKDLSDKTDVSDNKVDIVEPVLKKQRIHYDPGSQSVSPRILINQQIQEPQIKSSQTKIENNPSLSRKSSNRKRTRTNFCKSQLSVLEHQFMECKYPDLCTISQLASIINVTSDKIKNWFKNRRSKQKDLEKNNQIAQPKTETFGHAQINAPFVQKCKRTSNRIIQLGVLERAFKDCPYPDLDQLCQVASKIKFTNSQVRRWFTCRRAKQRLLEKRATKISHAKKEPSNFTLPLKPFELNYRLKGTDLTLSNETYRLSRQITGFNEDQLAILEDEFNKCQNPNCDTYMNLASIINVPYIRICKWFVDRRAKERTPESALLFDTSRPQYSVRKIHFTKTQVDILEQAFARSQYLDVDTTYYLAARINVSYERVRTWFTNRRTKQRQLNKYGQQSQSQTETHRFLPSSEIRLRDELSHERQIQSCQNYQKLPMYGVYCYNNALCNNIQQMRIYPQNLRFGWFNSVSPAFILQSYGIPKFSPIQEATFYMNPTPTSAQPMCSHSFNAPMPNHTFLTEL